MLHFHAFLQLLLVSLVSAAPVHAEGHGNAWQYGAGGGVIGFIVLILDVIAIRKSRALPPSPASLSPRLLHYPPIPHETVLQDDDVDHPR